MKDKRYLGMLSLAAFVAIVGFLNWAYIWCSDDCTCEIAKYGPRYFPVWDIFWSTFPFGYRPLCHVWTRVFTGCFPKEVWNVVNTAFAGGLILLLVRVAKHKWNFSFEAIAWAIILTFFCLLKGETFIGGAAATNYLWASCVTLGFLMIRERVEDASRLANVLLLAIGAFFAGWMQESFSLPILFALGVSYLVRLRELSVRKICVYGAYALGAVALCLVASRRCTSVGPESIRDFAITALKIAASLKAVWILIVALVFSRRRVEIVQRNAFELWVIAGSVLMIMAVGFNGERCLFVANMSAVLILIREFPIRRIWCHCGMVAVLLVGAMLVPLALQIRGNMQEFISGYLQSTDGVTIHERTECGLLSRYFYQILYKWQADPNGHARYLADFYGKPGMPLALTRNLYDHLYLKDEFCVEGNRLTVSGRDFFTQPQESTLVVPLKGEPACSEQIKVKVSYRQMTALESVRAQFIRSHWPILPKADIAQVLHTGHGDYLLIPKVPHLDRFIESVEVRE